jgi:hypothetical protein
MAEVPMIPLGRILTDDQLKAVLAIGNNPARVTREVIEPAMAEIDRKLGQENDARYLGYMICYTLERAGAFDQPETFLLHGLN